MQNLKLVLAAPLCAVLLVLALVGCQPSQLQIQAAAADALGRSVNALTPGLVVAYETDCGAKADKGGTPAATECKASWKKLWDAIEVLAAAQDAWAVAIVAGQDGNWNRLVGAGCDLVKVLKIVAPTFKIPLLSGACQ